jgi:hypothetical protein
MRPRGAWLVALAASTALAAATLIAPADAASKSGTAKSKSTNSTRQFTGYVVAIDKATLTVEKRGEKPRTLVFTKHSEMKTTGDVEKDARVTVYYRGQGDQLTAHKVVVKSEDGTSKKSGSRSRTKSNEGP